jgi:hypothetical protein
MTKPAGIFIDIYFMNYLGAMRYRLTGLRQGDISMAKNSGRAFVEQAVRALTGTHQQLAQYPIH